MATETWRIEEHSSPETSVIDRPAERLEIETVLDVFWLARNNFRLPGWLGIECGY
jgi:hypothetical protein